MDKKLTFGELISIALVLLSMIAYGAWWVSNVNQLINEMDKEIDEIKRKVETLEDKESKVEGRLSL